MSCGCMLHVTWLYVTWPHVIWLHVTWLQASTAAEQAAHLLCRLALPPEPPLSCLDYNHTVLSQVLSA